MVFLFSTHTSVFMAEDRASRERAFISQPHNALNLERISGTFRCAVVDDPNSEKSLDPTEYAEFASAPFSGCYSSLWSYLENRMAFKYNYAWYKTQVFQIPECVKVSEPYFKGIVEKKKQGEVEDEEEVVIDQGHHSPIH